MNLENLSSGGLGGLLGGILALLGFNRRLSKLEEKIENVVDHKACENIRNDTKQHISDMKEDIRYIRARLDEVISDTKRHKEDY